MKKISIVLPVYDGLAETQRCLESVFTSLPLHKNNIELLVINDASPNPAITEYLRDAAKKESFTLIENENNRGFVATVNIGMKLNAGDDVVLLNSDTEVANDWLDRLVDAAYQNKQIATVTPFSNNAEICSFPVLCADNQLPLGLSVAEIDQQFATLTSMALIEIPTAVGFCMYIKRDCINDIGYFDEKTFGRGYGEENDFCQRAIKQQWTNVLCPNVFVFHEGGVSFSDEKAQRIQNAMTILDRLYPDYHGSVHAHIQLNPAKAYRLMGLIHLYQNSDWPTVLHITHHLGGGTIKYVDDLCDMNQGKLNTLVLQRTQDGLLALYFGNLQGESITFSFHEFDELKALLVSMRVSYAHLHHVMDVPEIVFQLLEALSLPYDVTLHDYYFINANPTLTDQSGRFCEDLEQRDDLCSAERPVPNGLTGRQWRELHGRLLKRAQRVISPCKATRDIYQDYFPELNYVVSPHSDRELQGDYPVVQLEAGQLVEKLRILAIGALSREKGGEVLEKTAQCAAQDDFEFHLLGYSFKPLAKPVIEHGPYRESELAALIEKIDPHLIWFPGQWPETYCYTLSAALHSGRPIVATDIGSFPERIAGRPFSWLKSWQLSPEKWVDFFNELKAEVFDGVASERVEWVSQEQCCSETAFYQNAYVTDIIDKQSMGVLPVSSISINLAFIQRQVGEHQQSISEVLGRKEKILLLLMKLRNHRVTGKVARLIPFSVQRAIKRRLSRAPIHDVVLKNKQ